MAVDLRPLQEDSRYRGIGRVLADVLPHLPRLRPAWRWVGYAHAGLPAPEIAGYRLRALPSPKLHRLLSPWIERAVMGVALRWDGPEAFLVTDPAKGVPRFGGRVVSLFYDAIPSLYPREYFPDERVRSVKDARKWLWSRVEEVTYRAGMETLRDAHRVLAISRASAKDACRVFRLDPFKVGILPLRVASRAAAGTAGPASRVPYLLYVGGVDYRKNIPMVFEVFERLARKHADLRLVLVGRDLLRVDLPEVRKLEEWLARTGLGQRVQRAGFVDDCRLSALYRGARALLFPSRYEGYGLPVAEALAAGCPVVCAPAGALAEIVDPLVSSPDDASGFVDALERVLADPETARERALEQGRRLCERAPEDAALAVIRAFEEIL